MRTSLLVKLAASSMIVGGMTVAQNAYADFGMRGDATAARESARIAAKAEAALAKDPARAIFSAEHAVSLSPANADHRMLLGRAYLAAGRFQAAASAFEDVLALDPSRGRAALSLALAKLALGDKDGARALLDKHGDRIAAGDRGLALTLAGDAPAGVAVLEAAVRGGGNDAKTRQNLAYGYAMSGRWVEAKLMASYDLDPASVTKRIMDWSRLAAGEETAATQVAAMLGVAPAEDPGMPVRLALNPPSEPTRMAEARVAPPPPMRIAEASLPEIAAPKPAIVFAAPREVVQPIRTAEAASRKPAPVRTAVAPRPTYVPVATSGPGSFAVQIGAFDSPAAAEAGWTKAVARAGYLDSHRPGVATVRTAAATFYRLSVTGLADRAAAVSLCERYRARGGQCFVRPVAGEAAPIWASRKPLRVAAR